MAKKNFVVRKGMSVGTANVDELSGNISTLGNVNIGGNLTVQSDAEIIGNLVIDGNVATTGQITAGNIYQNGNQVLDTTAQLRFQVTRENYSYTTPNILLNDVHEFEISLGVSVIVYRLTVSRPCKVEVFGSADKTELNPYTFIATEDHLTDDGSVLLSDGSVIQSRQYSIFANLETPAQPKVYVRISNVDNVTTPVTLSLVYFTGTAGLFL